MAVGSNILGRLVYAIGVDQRDLDTGLSTMESKVQAAVERLDREEATIELRAEKKQLDKDLKEARADLTKFGAEDVDVDLNLETAEFDKDYREAWLKVKQLEAQRINVQMDIDRNRQFSQQAARVARDVNKVKGEVQDAEGWLEKFSKRITGTRVNLGPFTTNMRTLAGVLVTLGPILSGLVGSLVALTGSLGEAAAGAAALGAAGFAGLAANATGAVLAIKPLSTMMTDVTAAQKSLRLATEKYGASSDEAKAAQERLNHTLAGAPPHIQEVTRRWDALKKSFLQRTQGIRANAVSVVNDAMRTAQKLLPDFARQSSRTFKVASDGFHDWLDGLRSPEAQHILDNIMGNFRRSLPDLLHGLGQFATAFARITSAASDFLPEFTKGFDQVGSDFADSTSNAKQLHHTIGNLVDQTHSWFRLLGATGRLLVTVLTGGARQGQRMVDDLTQSLKQWNRQLQTSRGQKAMHAFFKDSIDLTEKLFGTLRRTVTILFALSRATQPFADVFLTAANAVGDFVQGMEKIAPLKGLLEGIAAAMLAIWSVNKISAWYTAARLALIRIGALSAATSEEMQLAGNPAATGFTKNFARSLGIGLVALDLTNIIGNATGGDFKQAGFEAGGALLGGIAGSFIPGIGTILGAGIGGAAGGLLGGLFGGGEEKKKIGDLKKGLRELDREMKQDRKSSRSYAQAQQAVSDAHRRVKRTGDAVKEAEKHLLDVRKKYGPNSHQAIEAERKLVRLTNAHTTALHQEQRAERLQGIRAKARKHELQTELGSVRANNREAKNRITHLSQESNKLFQAGKTGERYHRINDRLDKSYAALARGSKRVNQILDEAASQIGPKWAKQLQNMSLRQLQFGRQSARLQHQQTQIATQEAHARDQAIQKSGGVWKFTLGQQRNQLDLTTQNLRSNTQDSKNFLTQNIIKPFGDAGDSSVKYRQHVTDSSGRAKQAVSQDTNDINRALESQLKKFSKGLQSGGGIKKQHGGSAQRKATGGFTVPGIGDGDKFDTILPSGSFILNRVASAAMGFATGGAVPVKLEAGERVFMPHEVAAIGPAVLNGINSTFSRFAGGGQTRLPKPVELLWQVPGHFDHLHAGFSDTGTTIRAGKAIQAMNYEVGEGPGPFGPITPGVHVNGSLHYQNRAIDVNDDAAPIAFGGSEGASLSHLFGMLKSGTLTPAKAIKLIRFIATRAATLGDVAGLNLLAATMEKWGNKKLGAMGSSGAIGGWKGINSAAEFIPYWNKVNPDLKRYAQTFAYIVPAESGWNPHASNGTHFGWYQFDAPTWSDFRPSGAPPAPEGPYDPGFATQGAGNVIRREGTSGFSRWTTFHGIAQRGGPLGMQGGGGLPGTLPVKLPPKPRGKPSKDFSTDSGSWYDWYNRAIDYYDTQGDTENEAGAFPVAAKDWKHALRQVLNERDQVRLILRHDSKRLRHFRREEHHLPKKLKEKRKALRKSEPPKHFRNRHHGESHATYKKHHDAWKQNRKAWEQKWRDYKRSVKDYQRKFEDKRKTIQGEMPDLWQQYRVDLPTRYNEIRDKITGQTTDRALEQTAFGQERYQAITEFGGNFSPLGFAIGKARSRFGVTGARATAATGTAAMNAASNASAAGAQAAATRARSAGTSGGGGGSVINKNIHVENHYLRPPEDPHTWSASVRHEIGALA